MEEKRKYLSGKTDFDIETDIKKLGFLKDYYERFTSLLNGEISKVDEKNIITINRR
jgi:hypothetical protein